MVLFGKSLAEVTDSVLVPGQVGLYRVTFKVPNDFGFKTLSVTVAGVTVETPLAVGNAIMPLYTSATQDQIEYIVPEGIASGTAELTIAVGPATWRGTLDVKPYAPRVLLVAPTVAATYLVRVSNGVQTVEPTFRVTADGNYEAILIDLGPEGDSVYLCLFGTGWHGRAPGYEVTLDHSLGDGTYLSVPAIHSGPQGEFAGMDQADFLHPRSIGGSGNLYTLHTFLNVGGTRVGFPGLVYK